MNRRLVVCASLLAMLSAGMPAIAQAPASGKVTLALRNTPIQEVFEMLSRNERVNILLGRGVVGNVSVNLYDVTVAHAVQAIADAAGYIAEARPNGWVILDRKEAFKDAVPANTLLRSFKVQYSNPKTVADILTKYLSRYGKITTLPERNLIVVEDLPDFVDRVQRLLTEIDVQPKQILIEARILEITLDETEAFGLDWSKVMNTRVGDFSVGTAGFAAARGSPGFFFSVITDHLNAFLTALSAKGRVQTLSAPKLLALENQEAAAVIGDRTGYKVTTTINLVTSESIQFLDSGVILKVTPSVDESGRILMKIHPEVSTASISAAGVPSKKSTEVTTQLLAENGQAIFIGGLIKRNAEYRRTGVPLLGDLPVIGRLFSKTGESQSHSETVVLITPRIVQPGTPSRVEQTRVDQVEGLLLRRSLELDARIDRPFAAPASPPAERAGTEPE